MVLVFLESSNHELQTLYRHYVVNSMSGRSYDASFEKLRQKFDPKIQRLAHISARLDRSWLPDSSVFRALLELSKKWSIAGIRFIFAEIDQF